MTFFPLPQSNTQPLRFLYGLTACWVDVALLSDRSWRPGSGRRGDLGGGGVLRRRLLQGHMGRLGGVVGDSLMTLGDRSP